jgi:hypothetical protein
VLKFPSCFGAPLCSLFFNPRMTHSSEQLLVWVFCWPEAWNVSETYKWLVSPNQLSIPKYFLLLLQLLLFRLLHPVASNSKRLHFDFRWFNSTSIRISADHAFLMAISLFKSRLV